ncbi:MAG TPA: hypothetical protein VJL56_05880 [Candidatus Bathyarchaeia archaeon]|nr:hypothetical protein [Candidatus Bathyarchaeia archaeon]
MKLQRSHVVIGILLVAVLALLIFTIQQNTAGGGVAATPPRTTVTGAVNSVQQNSNFSYVFFEDMKTHITYGTVVLNSTGSQSTCRIQPCTYSSISLYSNARYNVTIEEFVTTQVQGGGFIDVPRYCPAGPYTPTASTETHDFVCNTSFQK